MHNLWLTHMARYYIKGKGRFPKASKFQRKISYCPWTYKNFRIQLKIRTRAQVILLLTSLHWINFHMLSKFVCLYKRAYVHAWYKYRCIEKFIQFQSFMCLKTCLPTYWRLLNIYSYQIVQNIRISTRGIYFAFCAPKGGGKVFKSRYAREEFLVAKSATKNSTLDYSQEKLFTRNL